MKKLNKLLSCIMLVCTAMTLFGSVCANALTGFDSDAKCLLRVLVLNEHDLEQPVTDAEVTLYRAADVEFADEQANYPCTDDFKGCADQLENVSSEDNAEKLFEYAVKNILTDIPHLRGISVFCFTRAMKHSLCVYLTIGYYPQSRH